MLSAILLLFDLKTVHAIANIFINEFFSLLRNELLPKGDKMPTTNYEACKIIKTFGLIYESIHAYTDALLSPLLNPLEGSTM
jgi:hypothetical protein